MKQTEVLTKFLHAQPYPVCKLYTPGMEVQVNVAKDGGEVSSGTFKGKTWRGYTDGLTTWKSFRIPWNAMTVPRYEDREAKYDISKHAEAIGMTGWDWAEKQSRWVAFDFDSIIGHKAGLTHEELKNILDKLSAIPWVTIYTSTGGVGYHPYVYINNSPVISNHNEHAALAKSILNTMSGLAGVKLEAKVDACGSNMWIWARRAVIGTSFKLLKKGCELEKVPNNWEDYLRTSSASPRPSEEADIAAAHAHMPLEKAHTQLLKWFERNTENCLWWWNADKHMLICHTYDLGLAHKELGLVGIYDTIATGRDKGHDQNCFCFPECGGGWRVRRHNKGIQESPTWYTDTGGWTCCNYNELPTISVAVRRYDGVEAGSEYHFKTLDAAFSVLISITGKEHTCPPLYIRREAIFKYTEGKCTIKFPRSELDVLEDWAEKGKYWVKSFFVGKVTDDLELPDQLIRHLTASGKNLGWMLKSGEWIEQTKSNLYNVLLVEGYNKHDIDLILGKCVLHHWRLVNKPFTPEYPGNREWNMHAPQLRYEPEKGKHDNWDRIFDHLGADLNEDITPWLREVGIVSGSLYLQCWVACLFQEPHEPLPYLALYGGQNTGKSTLHEALTILTTRGIIRADASLLNSNGFNGELAGAVLCVVEETDLSKGNQATNRIKDWVTAKSISIHNKGKTPYEQPNYTHWVQCTNDPSECPVFPGDTRIVMVQVNTLRSEIPKSLFMERLEREAPAFLYTMLHWDLPERIGRLRLPTLETGVKQMQQDINQSSVETFVAERALSILGASVRYSEFYNQFSEWAGPDVSFWTKHKVGKEMARLGYPKGKASGNGDLYLGNICFEPCTAGSKLRLVKGRLR